MFGSGLPGIRFGHRCVLDNVWCQGYNITGHLYPFYWMYNLLFCRPSFSSHIPVQLNGKLWQDKTSNILRICIISKHVLYRKNCSSSALTCSCADSLAVQQCHFYKHWWSFSCWDDTFSESCMRWQQWCIGVVPSHSECSLLLLKLFFKWTFYH